MAFPGWNPRNFSKTRASFGTSPGNPNLNFPSHKKAPFKPPGFSKGLLNNKFHFFTQNFLNSPARRRERPGNTPFEGGTHPELWLWGGLLFNKSESRVLTQPSSKRAPLNTSLGGPPQQCVFLNPHGGGGISLSLPTNKDGRRRLHFCV